jgi:hypothetical protein
MEQSTSGKRRGRIGVVVGSVVLLVLAAGLVIRAGRGSGDDPGAGDLLAPGSPPPPGVERAAEALAGDADAQRAVLSPQLAEALAAGESEGGGAGDGQRTGGSGGDQRSVLPPGSRLRLDDDGWRSEIDGFGGATGRLVLADGGEVPVEVGLVLVEEGWRVTYVLRGEER